MRLAADGQSPAPWDVRGHSLTGAACLLVIR